MFPFVYWHISLIYLYIYTANTKHLYNICTMSAQRLRLQMVYKCFVFTDGKLMQLIRFV